jgi:hypothetical protein
MFQDFVRLGGRLDLCQLVFKKRIVKSKKAKQVFRPKTRAELVDRFKD